MSLYKYKGSQHLPWGSSPQASHGKSEMMILTKGISVMVLVRHHSCTLKTEASKRPWHSLPLHPLSFHISSRLQVGSSQEWCLQTLLTVAHTRLKQLTRSTSAAVRAKLHAPRIHSIVLILVHLDVDLQRGKAVKTWGWLVRKAGVSSPAKPGRGPNLGWMAAAGLP